MTGDYSVAVTKRNKRGNTPALVLAQIDAPMLVKGLERIFLIIISGILNWKDNRAGLLGRTRQGRAAQVEGKLLLGHVASRSMGTRGRPANRSKASTSAAAD